MLKHISDKEFSGDTYAYGWLRSWTALDLEHGAVLVRSNGIGKYGNQVYYLLVYGKKDDITQLAGDWVYRKRFSVNPWAATIEEVIFDANQYLYKWLEKQGVGK